MSSITKNRNYPVYSADDNNGTFLSFRTTIAGPGTGSALVMIDQDMADLFTAVNALQEEGSSVETISFTYQEEDGYYVGGTTELKTKAILIFSIDDNSIEVETKLNVANTGAKYLKRHDYKGEYINVLNSELVVNKQYLTYFDGEYYMLVGCVVNEGEAGNMFVTGSEAEAKTNILSGDSLKIAFGKIRRWFSDFGALAWKNTISSNEIDNAAVTNDKLAVVPSKTMKGNVSSSNGEVTDLTAEEIRNFLDVNENSDNTQAFILGAVDKDAIVEQDDIVIKDSDDSNVKKVKFSVLKAIFDKAYAALNHDHTWTEIKDVPTVFEPAEHTHSFDKLTDLPEAYKPEEHTHSFNELSDIPGEFTPTLHASVHAKGGDDPITPVSIGALDETEANKFYVRKDTNITLDGKYYVHDAAGVRLAVLDADDSNLSVLSLEPILDVENNSTYLYLRDEYNGVQTVGIQNVAHPIQTTDAATKGYVDNKILYGTSAPTEDDGEDGSIWIVYS